MAVTAGRSTGVSEVVAASQTIAAAGTTNGPTLSNLSLAQNVVLQVNVTAITGTAPTLTVNFQDTVDGGANWNTVFSTTAQTATGVTVVRSTALFSDQARLQYVVAGTTPSVTFRVDWYTESNAPIPLGS